MKILPDSFAHDPDRTVRFAREAHVLASLNQLNIASIYGLEERALVLELVEGPTLAEWAAPGGCSTLFGVPAAGGIPQPIMKFDSSRNEVTHRMPWLLPGARVELCTHASQGGRYETPAIVAQNLETGQLGCSQQRNDCALSSSW